MQPVRGFDDGDEVSMVVMQGGRRVLVVFIIAKARITAAGRWEYQLKSKDSRGLYEDGKWFRESELRWA